jgi:hypothetical protein
MYTTKAVATFLEELLLWDGPFGQWPEELLSEWINNAHVSNFEDLGINLHPYASLTKDNLPRVETI